MGWRLSHRVARSVWHARPARRVRRIAKPMHILFPRSAQQWLCWGPQ